MGFLARLLGSTLEEPSSSTPDAYGWTPPSEADAAWLSADLPRMIRAVDTEAKPVDRHFLLMRIVKETYRLRADPNMADKCAEVAQIHIDEFSVIAPPLKKDFGEGLPGSLPRVSTFAQFATLLTERGEFQRAIQVCETAISYGLRDGTKSGYKGRIKRIQKKMDRAVR